MYELVFDEKVLQYLEKLPKNISKRIFKKLQDTKEKPHHYFVKLTDRSEYKLRVGDYRVIADIEENKLIIYVIHVDHRKNVYKRL
ncbi:MAG: type II toxin-antitoxin system RelE family toxin [Nanobdellota archaeon]